ncbi:MAG: hypothetical protein A2787_07705 [Omnitrophica WOR_2 bacterium RIFCSPHIGHO2_01_FULL_48_9]|nr:MAG: hypothetical protein A3D10_05725 [Omnitrophica WOR_2 bacterium RIFCSPHIGHO2_02_FULL_48_11]OGX32576.1 MAG: hypothetical protein A2787_07705 [Omnitrophica WOR_2 bacterium RIFCSPHIGHO2_01_FULL_48_9]
MKKKEDDLTFEIQFYEGLIKKKPDFVEALAALGDIYTKQGFYEKGLTIDRKLSVLRPEDPNVFYNLACSYSLVNNIDQALAAMQQATEYGYHDFDYLQKDSDLENLRRDTRFEHFLANVKNKKSP